MSNLKSVINQISSDKIKERQEGINALRTVLSQRRAVDHLDAEGKGQTWLVVFQALFKAVLTERTLYDKKPGDAAGRRLRDAASAVRWLTETVVDRLNRKVIRALLAQILDMIVHRGKLFAPVALDYAKALKTVIGFQAHMDHLDDANWIAILQLAFNVVLRDRLRSRLDEEDDELDESVGGPSDGSDSYQGPSDNNKDEEDLPSTSALAQSRKRRRADSSRHSTPLAKRRPNVPHAASNEQVEFACILLILLRAPSAPLLSPEHPYLPPAVLKRLRRFLTIYPGETSLHRDYLLTLSATLSHLSLNKKSDIETFARHSWAGLVDLWGTGSKSRWIKEALLPVLRALFPYLTADENSSSAWADGVSKLWGLFNGEAESRWGVDGLSLDSLRFEIIPLEEWEDGNERGRPFVAQTFRAGCHFDAAQALAWTILELQADCTEKLFVLSESGAFKGEGKRGRVENPITALLNSIQSETSATVRAYHLQILLFFIDRHWTTLHDTFQQDIINMLLQFVSFEDGIIQAWVFMCFAAIAHIDGRSSPTVETQSSQSQSLNNGRSRDPVTWDPIWTHSIRRANVPAVCRAACHTAFVLLTHAKRLLTSPRVLLEIESLAKDLDVQGPSFPYDSVCAFLAKSLLVASQDVRLYRMQLEEKALSWLMDSWRMESGQVGKSKMASHSVADVLLLLEGICGFSTKSDLVCRTLLPECPITDIVVEETSTKVIRDFLLQASLPPFRPSGHNGEVAAVTAPTTSNTDAKVAIPGAAGLVEAVGRERKISAFMLKSLDTLLSEWNASKEGNFHCTAENVRQLVDAAILALAYEALLPLNGIRSNRRVIQAAGRLLLAITPILASPRWTNEEQALVLLGLDPLTALDGDPIICEPWETMPPPDVGTGIKLETLRKLRSAVESKREHVQASRRNFQRMIWQDMDVQHAFTSVLPIFKDILRARALSNGTSFSMDIDYNESFGLIRTAQTNADAHEIFNHASRSIVDICISFLAVVPILESYSGEPIRDKELTQQVMDCSHEQFFLLAPIFFGKVQQRILNLSTSNLKDFLEKFSSLVTDNYTYGRCEKVLLLLVQFLRSTLPVWLQDTVSATQVGRDIGDLMHWLAQLIENKHARSWKIRDAIILFFDDYLAQDPGQTLWRSVDVGSQESDFSSSDIMPSNLLPQLAADADIRVRFRAAVVNARLFSIAQSLGNDVMDLYSEILGCLTKDIDDFEHMLTRMLALGNVMVVSSAVRRGPYWHLLEACLHRAVYNRHIISILRGVSQRMGLLPWKLFEVYASQIAYSIRQAGHDFLRFPPHVLGYEDRRECAENTFRAFTPTNVLAGGPDPNSVAHGQKLFANHCRAIQRTTADGLRECFGDIIGIQIASWIDDAHAGGRSPDELEEALRAKITSVADFGDFDVALNQDIDGVVVAILRTMSDHGNSNDGSVMQALSSVENSADVTRAFQELTHYRHTNGFLTHEPNLPAFPASTVLLALNWLFHWKPSLGTMPATTYHVMHELFADVERLPLVNEQMRILNALCLWVALRQAEFQNFTLLHTLIQGASCLFAQSDLARAAQSMLEWSFACYRKNAFKDPRFPDVLIRISCLAYDYAKSTDAATSNLGQDLLRWIDQQALQLCKIPVLRGQVVKALPAWPHQPLPELTQIYEDISSESLSALLGDQRISSNQFRLVRRLRDRAMRKDYGQKQFSSSDFWRLKACIPPADQMHDQDIDAFATLLILNHGSVDSFGSEQHQVQSVRDRHRRGSRKRPTGPLNDDTTRQQAIVLSLLAMLDCTSLTQVHMAYRTLRYLISSADLSTPLPDPWPSEHRCELQFLKAYPRIPRKRPPRDPKDLLSSANRLGLSNFSDWISQFTVLLCDTLAASDLFYAHLTSIVQFDVDFAEEMLPVLIHCLLRRENTETGFSVRSVISEYLTSVLMSGTAHVRCLRSVVDTVLHLRNFNPDGASDSLAHDKWLDIDFTLLARNAITCGAYTTALLFLELATEYSDPAFKDDAATEQILFDIYSHIDEPDGFYGIQTNDLRHFLLKRFHHEKQWEKAFRFHGAALEAGTMDASAEEGLLQSFHAFGFDHLAINTLQAASAGTSNSQSSGVPGMSYRLGWRTETWDLPDQQREKNCDASLYLALRAIHRERDHSRADLVVRHALSNEMGRLRDSGVENIAEIRQITRNLMCLHQITRWRQCDIQERLSSKRIDLKEWEDFVSIPCNFEFADLESIMATRISLVRSVRQKEERNQIGNFIAPFAQGLIDLETRCLSRLSEAARDANQVQVALNSVVRAQHLEHTTSFEVAQEFASVLWLQHEQKLAVQFLKELIRQARIDDFSTSDGDKVKKALMLARLGSWTAEACLEKPTDILCNFFDPAIRLISGVAHGCPSSLDPSYASVYHQCATFAEHQYRHIVKSPDAIRWKIYVDRKTQEINKRRIELQRTQRENAAYRELYSHQTKAEAQLKEDMQSFRLHEGARDKFLRQAIDMYSRSLEASDTFDDDAAIRLCSLWFANFDDETLQDASGLSLSRVASRKFVFLAHQLSARLSKGQTSPPKRSQEHLQALIVRMCREHPFHSLYQVYCLRADHPSLLPRRQSSRLESPASHSERASAANDILGQLRQDDNNRERVCAVERICDACLEWAKLPLKNDSRFKERKRRTGLEVPLNLQIREIKSTRVPVLTVHTPLDPTMKYDDCIWIEGYDTTFEIANGINLPKIICCIGSDGVKYKQLFKGEGDDDLRQDAVMEQVFDRVNIVLRQDRETRRRNLGVRGYKVIPLASQAGILEFVGNTLPLQGWLKQAHTKYRPTDPKPDFILEQLKAKQAQYKRGPSEPLVTFFTEVRQTLKPVMRHYFTERHKNPIAWFAMRLNYTRSVATTSIVGHVLGLGDRHPSNILLDNVTGEVVHIDFGIAFDQGKLLPVPERVPFRMTADMIDGMGTSGTQGVFQRCAEETLRVLREGSEIIMTVLEVFKHDPLHQWTASEVKVHKVQNVSKHHGSNKGISRHRDLDIDLTSGTADEAADRALSSVARKLDTTLTVEYTVNELLAEATDVVNLALIYPGWAPHL